MECVSRERVTKLVKGEILPQVDFTDWDVYVECIKVKQIKCTSKHLTISSESLELIQIDIYGPFDTPS